MKCLHVLCKYGDIHRDIVIQILNFLFYNSRSLILIIVKKIYYLQFNIFFYKKLYNCIFRNKDIKDKKYQK